MKKTLFSVLAFVLVLTTVLTGIAVTSISAEANRDMGACYQVDPDNPIIVDGKMDKAYSYGFSVMLDCRVGEYPGLYTYGIAYFAWSGSSIYCYVIVNDVDVADPAAPWAADAVEMYIHRGDDILRDYADTTNEYLNSEEMPKAPDYDENGNKSAHAGVQRGRQYRIDGKTGAPTCYLFGEMLTYSWNEEKGRLYNEKGVMIGDDFNHFGWNPGGWANNVFEGGTSGYAVEYKIDFDEPLEAGEKFRFDLMVADRYGPVNNRQQANFYYTSGLRETAGAVISRIENYDHFTLTDATVNNDGIIADEDLYNYGRGDASTSSVEQATTKSLVKTTKYSFNRTRTGTMPSATNSQVNTGNQPGGEGGNAPGGEGGATTPSNTTTNQGGGSASSGGCGGSIAATASAAVLAAVGAAGFYVFRRRDEE